MSQILDRSQSTISEHLMPLQKKGLVFLWETKKYNEKEYMVDCEKIAELFFLVFLKKPEFTKYKDNNLLTLTFAAIISAKRGLLEKEPRKFDRIDLTDIFSEAWMYFYSRSKALVNGNESLALKGYTAKENKEKVENEFKNFLKEIYKDMKERIEEEKRQEEEEKAKKGEKLIKEVKLDVNYDKS